MKGIQYTAIPSKDGAGKLCLTIYPPGKWMDNTDYACFMGGCGVGHGDTLELAETLLLKRVRQEIQYRISEAEATAAHYRIQFERLERCGTLRKFK